VSPPALCAADGPIRVRPGPGCRHAVRRIRSAG
jgi:hypothetical protein